MTGDTIKAFAALLAAANDNERAALLARVKLLAMQDAAPEAFEAPISTLGEYLARDIPVPPILVEPALVVRGGITCVVARAGYGKTQLSLNRLMRWAAGKPMFEGLTTKDGTGILAPTKPLRSLIIENEGSAGMFQRQVGIMFNANGYLTDEDRDAVRENILVWGDGGWSGLKLDDPQQLDMVRAGCEKWEPDIVFIEPFRGLWKGDENSATDMAVIADALSAVAAEYECGVLIAHHQRKAGVGEDGEKMSAGRGSTVLEGVVATMENFDKAKGGDFRELSWSKVRHGSGRTLLPVRMVWDPVAWWYSFVPLNEIEQTILDELADADPEPLTVKDLIERTDEKDHTVRRTLKSLLEGDTPKIKKMSSTHNVSGSSGVRYRLITPSTEGDESLDF